MFDIADDVRRINGTGFFSCLGENNLTGSNIIQLNDVRTAFIAPSDAAFQGYYHHTLWLPTAADEGDPFYQRLPAPAALLAARRDINKAVMQATRAIPKTLLRCDAHDFSVAARQAACFAFRQYISERWYADGDKWQRIAEIYYAGHWPVGYAGDCLIVI